MPTAATIQLLDALGNANNELNCHRDATVAVAATHRAFLESASLPFSLLEASSVFATPPSVTRELVRVLVVAPLVRKLPLTCFLTLGRLGDSGRGSSGVSGMLTDRDWRALALGVSEREGIRVGTHVSAFLLAPADELALEVVIVLSAMASAV